MKEKRDREPLGLSQNIKFHVIFDLSNVIVEIFLGALEIAINRIFLKMLFAGMLGRMVSMQSRWSAALCQMCNLIQRQEHSFRLARQLGQSY